MIAQASIKVIVVDDSAVVREILGRQLDQAPDIEVVAVAPDPYVARELILRHTPDVVTLDLEMPRMDGLTFLRKLMRHLPIPVVVVSSLTPAGSELALSALDAGAVEVVCKPGAAYTVGDITFDLREKIRAAAVARLDRPACHADPAGDEVGALPVTSHGIIAIGASTGGTQALASWFGAMPADAPPTLVTQHMPESFTRAFAMRLDEGSRMLVKEAEPGDPVVPGVALVARGNHHLVLKRSGARYEVSLKSGPLVNRHRPSVDVMFRSVARSAGRNAVGVLMTGMGEDGARGLLEMRQAGAATFAQDEASCVVYGMSRAALQMEAVDRTTSLQALPSLVMRRAARAHAGDVSGAGGPLGASHVEPRRNHA